MDTFVPKMFQKCSELFDKTAVVIHFRVSDTVICSVYEN